MGIGLFKVRPNIFRPASWYYPSLLAPPRERNRSQRTSRPGDFLVSTDGQLHRVERQVFLSTYEIQAEDDIHKGQGDDGPCESSNEDEERRQRRESGAHATVLAGIHNSMAERYSSLFGYV